MEIRQMIYFKELCRDLNLASAAKSLYLTPQALSKSMRNLASEFETEIFHRDHNKLQLTTFGKALLQEIDILLTQYEQAKERLENIATQESGLVKITFSHGILQGKVTEFFKDYQQRNPLTALELTELPDIFAEQYVDQEECDFGFSIGLPQHVNNFDCHLVIQSKLCAVVHPNHPLADKSETSLKQCCLYPIISKNKIFKVTGILEECAQRQNIKLTYRLQSPNEIMWSQLVESNQGVGIGIMYYNLVTVPRADIVSIPFIEPELTWNVYLIVRKNHYLSQTTTKLIEELLTFFRQETIFGCPSQPK